MRRLWLLLLLLIFLAQPAAADTWESKLLAIFDDDTNDNFFTEIVGANNNPPSFSGDLTKYCVKIVVTLGDGLDDGDGLEFSHSNDGSTDAVTIGSITGTTLNIEATYWVNSTDPTLLDQVEHDGTQEWLHVLELGVIR